VGLPWSSIPINLERQLYGSLLGQAVKHHKAGSVGSCHDDIGPPVTIQIGSIHAIDRSVAVANNTG
jgi:hypothetical protein